MHSDSINYQQLASAIKTWGHALGFQSIGISNTDLSHAEAGFSQWLARGFHGEMSFMARHGMMRLRPAELLPGTIRVITARMSYLSANTYPAEKALAEADTAYISRYALGRDYHKVLRARLQQLCDRIVANIGSFSYRVLTDSAPVAEVALAEKSGIGWQGKHTLSITRDAGSWFFLGEIYTDLPLPADTTANNHCGSCTACLAACPTAAIVAPYEVDARRCISYLTIELKGSIPVNLRPLIGNRIYGCDDCQLCCPWNRFAQLSAEPDFRARHQLDHRSLITLFSWDESMFKDKTAGSAIRRIGHERWLRNIAVALGNASNIPKSIAALQTRSDHPSQLVREHVAWAIQQLNSVSARSHEAKPARPK